MTLTEMLVTVGGLVLGYVIVNRMFFGDDDAPGIYGGDEAKPQAEQQPPPREPPPGERENQQGYEPFGPRWATVLGVRSDATREEVSAAYKRKISEYHPDKVTRLGPEIRELAEQRSKEINAAYDEAMRRFSR